VCLCVWVALLNDAYVHAYFHTHSNTHTHTLTHTHTHLVSMANWPRTGQITPCLRRRCTTNYRRQLAYSRMRSRMTNHTPHTVSQVRNGRVCVYVPLTCTYFDVCNVSLLYIAFVLSICMHSLICACIYVCTQATTWTCWPTPSSKRSSRRFYLRGQR
jgi:hypothetical protein